MHQLYLIRHGLAADGDLYEQDADRPLTEKGLAKTQRIAQHLYQLGLRFDRLLCSPLVRAQQTAQLLHTEQLSTSVDIFPALAPNGDLQEWLDWWNQHQDGNQDQDKPDSQDSDNRESAKSGQTIAIVGHQPDLGNWAEALVWGQAGEKLIVKKAGIIGVELPSKEVVPGSCELFWLTPPRLLLA